MNISQEQLEALRYAARVPPITHLYDGGWTKELHDRVYVPLLTAGLIVQTTVRGGKYPITREGPPIYEATDAGRVLVKKAEELTAWGLQKRLKMADVDGIAATFKNVIPNGFNLAGLTGEEQDRLTLKYESTFLIGGLAQSHVRIDWVSSNTPVYFRVASPSPSDPTRYDDAAHVILPIELHPGDKIEVLLVSPPLSLRHVFVNMYGAELP